VDDEGKVILDDNDIAAVRLARKEEEKITVGLASDAGKR
jgi:hypothetical protein